MRPDRENNGLNTLVLGMGSEVLADSGIGPGIIHILQKKLPACLYDFEISPLGGMQLIDLIKDRDLAFIIDSTFNSDEPIGTLHIYDETNIPDSCNLSCSHDLSFREMLHLSEACGLQIPGQIWIITISIRDDKTIIEKLHPLLEERIGEISSEIEGFISGKRDETINERQINTLHHGLPV